MSRIFVWPASRSLTLRKSTTDLIIHCTATRAGQNVDATTVDGWHLANKWAGIGYHYLIHLDGSIEAGRPEKAVGSHVAGHNSNSIGIVYAGGLNAQGVPTDTRTPEQKDAMLQLVRSLHAKYRFKKIAGHRDYSPDANHNGKIDSYEWLKACPCFEVDAWRQKECIVLNR